MQPALRSPVNLVHTFSFEKNKCSFVKWSYSTFSFHFTLFTYPKINVCTSLLSCCCRISYSCVQISFHFLPSHFLKTLQKVHEGVPQAMLNNPWITLLLARILFNHLPEFSKPPACSSHRCRSGSILGTSASQAPRKKNSTMAKISRTLLPISKKLNYF